MTHLPSKLLACTSLAAIIFFTTSPVQAANGIGQCVGHVVSLNQFNPDGSYVVDRLDFVSSTEANCRVALFRAYLPSNLSLTGDPIWAPQGRHISRAESQGLND